MLRFQITQFFKLSITIPAKEMYINRPAVIAKIHSLTAGFESTLIIISNEHRPANDPRPLNRIICQFLNPAVNKRP